MKLLKFLIVALIFVSCSVQQRHYRNGVYLSKIHRHPVKQTSQTFNSYNPINPLPENNSVIEASAGKDFTTIQPLKKQTYITAQEPDSCDLLVYRDGTEVLVKTTEISEFQVRYKRCDNLNGPTFVTEKSDLFMIKYANGSKELMKVEAPKVTVISPPPAKTTKSAPRQQYEEPSSANAALLSGISAVLSIIAAIFFPLFLISAVLATVRAIVAGKKYFAITREEPMMYPGRAKAAAGLILGIIAATLLIIFTLLLVIIILTI